MLLKAVVVDAELDAFTSNGETYVLLQQLKEAFRQHLSYSSFMRRKYRIVRSKNEQSCPSSILEEYKARGLVAGPSQRCTAVTLAQGRQLAECCRSCSEGESVNSSSELQGSDCEQANVDVSALTTEQTQASIAATPATGTAVERFLQLRANDFPTFAGELIELKRYLSEPLSTRRRGDPLAQSTVQATERRLLSTG